MWKKEYKKFEGLTPKKYEKYRYGLGKQGTFIYKEEPTIDHSGIMEIMYLDSDDGCLIFSSVNDRFENRGVQVKPIDCQWADITVDTLKKITHDMDAFFMTDEARLKKHAELVDTYEEKLGSN